MMPVAAELKPAVTADDLFNAVARRYEAPWVLRRELTLGGRRIDCVAFGMPGSTKCMIIAFEFKVSRSDWLRELENHAKSEGWMNEADAFIVVTCPGVVKPGELPAGWGHLEFTGAKLMTRAHAIYREHRGEMSRELAMRLIRTAHQREEHAQRNAKWQLENQIRAEVEARHAAKLERDAAAERGELVRAKAELEAVYSTFGVRRHRWDADRALLRAAGLASEALAAETPDLWFADRVHAAIAASEERARQLRAALDALLAPTGGA